jgi:hypothetical protein
MSDRHPALEIVDAVQRGEPAPPQLVGVGVQAPPFLDRDAGRAA